MRLSLLPPHGVPEFPDPSQALREPDGLLAIGGNLEPATLLAAYRRGIFPWFGAQDPILWWSPDPRLVFAVEQLRPNRRMARWLRASAWTLSADQDFTAVIDACAAPRKGQPETWIVPAMRAAYLRLHRLGHAHSIEVREHGKLVGGLYGVALGRVFFGESMFSAASNGSRVALLALAQAMRLWDMPLLDAQVCSAHLLRLGGQTWPRPRFLQLLSKLCAESGAAPEGSWQQAWPIAKASALGLRG